MPKIYDNIEHNLTKGLYEALEVSHRADFCVGYFNLRGWKEVAHAVEKLQGDTISEKGKAEFRVCRLLVGMQKTPDELLKEYVGKNANVSVSQQMLVELKKRLAVEFREQLAKSVPTTADEQALQQLKKQLIDHKLCVKLYARNLHAKLYLAYSPDKRLPLMGFLGSSNLTFSGLRGQGELNIDVLDQDAALKLSKWFTDRWEDRQSIDITQELIEVIDNSWAGKIQEPYHIYIKMAYHLSAEARAGIAQYRMPTIFGKELLDFQEKAVAIAARHLEKRGGVMIGDVVGLGKTMVATALAKMVEEYHNHETLIICPKNLETMWHNYAHKYELRYKIVPQSKLKDLEKLPRYRTVLIDESHNLRNSESKRYKALKEYLDRNNSQVILLSATPYNKTYIDLSNQLRLFIKGEKDLGIIPERYVQALGGEIKFQQKHSETFIRSIEAFEHSEFEDDWQELMRLYMVRRTRSFIKNHYTKTDSTNGRQFLTFADGTKSYFPDRIPKKVLYEFDASDENDVYAKLYSAKVVDSINELFLPRYGLQNYLHLTTHLKPNEEETKLIKTLSFAGRRLMGFCRTNLFKRLESSGYAFLLSLSRHILRNYVFIYALQNNLPVPIGKNIAQDLDEFVEDNDLDQDEEKENVLKLILDTQTYLNNAEKLYKRFLLPENTKKFNWLRTVFLANHTKEIEDKKTKKKTTIEVSLLNDLLEDSLQLIEILRLGQAWKPETDKQINALHKLITNTHKNEKVLIFTQFADTAYYLATELQKRGVQKLECVTGDSENPTELAHRFSPQSNKRTDIVKNGEELDILVATDVLSEGQNLQDAHIILNYDLPWAIIRLIQRAGRVDRIGQKAEQILCYSFLPEDGIEAIINLRGRLAQRIEENANVVGSDETFFEGDPINIADLYNEKSGILEADEDETATDLPSLAYQIWKEAIEKNPNLEKFIPKLDKVIYATKQNAEGKSKAGVIVYTQTVNENDLLTWLDLNGKVITHTQHTILKAAACTPNTVALPKIPHHHELVEQGVEIIEQEEQATGGVLGKKTGVKYLTYHAIKEYLEATTNALKFEKVQLDAEMLKKAMQEVHDKPLTEFAREILKRELRNNKLTLTDKQKIAEIVLSLKQEDRLTIELNKEQKKEAQIICSMAMV
jgi:superfamily II DNA or RNA helicase